MVELALAIGGLCLGAGIYVAVWWFYRCFLLDRTVYAVDVGYLFLFSVLPILLGLATGLGWFDEVPIFTYGVTT